MQSQPLTPQEIDALKETVARELKRQRETPLIISIMGQTGVGKSTLIYSLFDIDYKQASLRPDVRNAVRPVTRQVMTYTISGMRGFPITVYDMPGIGESEETDQAMLLEYREYFLRSDIVLWAIHVDNRAITFDARALQFMLADIPYEQRSVLMSRLTFVLMKADVLLPAPWVMVYMGKYAIFAPNKETQEILDAKEQYYQERLIKPYGEDIQAWTYNDAKFALDDPAFTYDEYMVSYRGLMTRLMVAGYKRRYPQYAEIFERLFDNYRIIACSALFKYNLAQLLLIILNKLDPAAIENLRQQIDIDTLNHVPFQRAKQLCNMRIIDVRHRRTLFDLSNGTFPRLGDRRLFR